jgi:hypothetical protein
MEADQHQRPGQSSGQEMKDCQHRALFDKRNAPNPEPIKAPGSTRHAQTSADMPSPRKTVLVYLRRPRRETDGQAVQRGPLIRERRRLPAQRSAGVALEPRRSRRQDRQGARGAEQTKAHGIRFKLTRRPQTRSTRSGIGESKSPGADRVPIWVFVRPSYFPQGGVSC